MFEPCNILFWATNLFSLVSRFVNTQAQKDQQNQCLLLWKQENNRTVRTVMLLLGMHSKIFPYDRLKLVFAKFYTTRYSHGHGISSVVVI
jgi:hypothetical protein